MKNFSKLLINSSTKLYKQNVQKVPEICQLLMHVQSGSMEEIKSMLEINKNLINEKDYDFRTALHIAASEGNLEVVQMLFQKGCEVNPVDRFVNKIF
jgi:glutaminase